MDFTPRTQQILEILLGGKGPVSKQEIADRLEVSKRTIQREFGFLENDISRYGLRLVNRKGKGIVISGELQNIERLRREVGKTAASKLQKRGFWSGKRLHAVSLSAWSVPAASVLPGSC